MYRITQIFKTSFNLSFTVLKNIILVQSIYFLKFCFSWFKTFLKKLLIFLVLKICYHCIEPTTNIFSYISFADKGAESTSRNYNTWFRYQHFFHYYSHLKTFCSKFDFKVVTIPRLVGQNSTSAIWSFDHSNLFLQPLFSDST